MSKFIASVLGRNTPEELAAKAKFMADSKLKALGGALLNRLDEEKNRLAKPGEVKATDTGTFSTIFRIPSSATEQNEASATIDRLLTKAKGASNDKALTAYIKGLPLELQANLYKKELGAIFSKKTTQDLLAVKGEVGSPSRVEEIATILAADPAHADNLKQATDIMTKTAAVSDKMTLSNIAVCFAPNLLNPTMQTVTSAPSVLVDIVAAQSSALAQDPLSKMRAAAADFVINKGPEVSPYSSPQDALGQTADERGYEIPVPSSRTTVQASGAADGEYVTAIRRGPDTGRKTSPRVVAPNLSDVSVTSSEPEAVRPPMPIPSEADSGVASAASSKELPTPTPMPMPRPPQKENRENFAAILDGIIARGPKNPAELAAQSAKSAAAKVADKGGAIR